MSTVCIHIDEGLNEQELEAIRTELMHIPHVRHVALNPRMPHDLVVEYDAHCNMPIKILHRIERRGLHPDIVSG
jgi:hypothetical protein